MQSKQRIAHPRRAAARIEENLKPLEHLSGQIRVRDQKALFQRADVPHLFGSVDENVEVLPHVSIRFCRSLPGQGAQNIPGRKIVAPGDARSQIEHRGIEPLNAELRCEFRLELADGIEHELGIEVAASDPGWGGGSHGGLRANLAAHGEGEKKAEFRDRQFK